MLAALFRRLKSPTPSNRGRLPPRKPHCEVLEDRTLPAASFMGLGDLPGGSFYSEAYGVSDDGTVVVGTGFPATNNSEAFRWSQATGIVSLNTAAGFYFRSAHSVSADGSVIVGLGHRGSPTGEAIRWTAATGPVGLGSFAGPGGPSQANGVSPDGTVVVGNASSLSGGLIPFRWTVQTGMVRLSFAVTNGTALGASEDGSVIAGWRASGGPVEAFRWTSETGVVGLGDLPGGPFGSQANDVSRDGSVIVGTGVTDLSLEAFRWTQATGMVGLSDRSRGHVFHQAGGVSADGSVIVGSGTTPEGIGGPYIWDAVNGPRSLVALLISEGVDLTGWRLLSATDVSADGRVIVGYGTNPNGQTEAWIARLNIAIAVSIDIKPGSFPNSINLHSNGVLPVAVLTTTAFDAARVAIADLSTIRLGDVDVTGRVSPLRAALADVDGDGDLDLLLHFSMRRVREVGALLPGSTTAELTGVTTNGSPFRGTDSVRIVSKADLEFEQAVLGNLVEALLGGQKRTFPSDGY